MRKENLFKNKATKGLVAALAFAMATTIVPVSADAAANSLTIAKGDSKKLAANLTNVKTSDSSVAKVNKKGKVTAKKAGKATITATQNGKTVTYKVTVKKAPKISKANVTVKVGKSKNVTVNKNGAKYLGVSFKSSKPAVAKVNKNGKITGVKKGTATITATVKGYNKTWKLKTTVTVKKAAGTTPTEPTEPVTPTEPTEPVTPAVTDQTINQASTLPDGEYNNVIITSNVADNTTVNLGNTKINKLYIESGSDYIVDATQTEIGEVEIVEKGGVTSKALNGSRAPRLNFGNNTKAANTKLTVKGDIQLTGSVKIASVSVLGTKIAVSVEIPVAVVAVEGNEARVSLASEIDEVAVKATGVTMSVSAAVAKVSVEGEGANIIVKANVTVAEMTVAAADVQVQGNGTVATLAINADNATIKTNVTTATVSVGVTNTTIAGQAVAAGLTVTNQVAVQGQTDTDAITITTTVTTPPTTTTTPSTTTPGSSSSNSGVTNTSQQDTASVTVGKGTNKFTATIPGVQSVTITKSDLRAYYVDKTSTDLPLTIVTDSGSRTEKVTPPITLTPGANGTSTASFEYEINGYKYKVDVTTIAGTQDQSATVTVTTSYTASSKLGLNLEADVVATYTGAVEMKNTQNQAVLKVGAEELTIKKDDVSKYYHGQSSLVGTLKNGTSLTLAPKAEKNDFKNDMSSLFAGTTTLDGTRVDLYVTSYTEAANEKTVKVMVVAYSENGVQPELTVS